MDVFSTDITPRRKKILCAFFSTLITAFILIIVFQISDIAPFGTARKTLACMDAEIQYDDFFAYLQNVAGGSSSIAYSFEKGLGGTAIAVFAYYLASPFNLIFLLVPKSMIHVVFNVVVMLKLIAASLTTSLFLSTRFGKLEGLLSVTLAISYSLMQYSIAQASNIMWLDGIYMLPVMALFTSRLIQNQKLSIPLSLSAGFAIVANWYSGAINCLFLIVWFFIELVMLRIKTDQHLNVSYVLRCGTLFAVSMLLGVGLSMALFLPAAISMFSGRAAGGWTAIDWLGFSGNPLKFLRGSIIGSTASAEQASFFCGSVALLGGLSMIICREIPLRERILLTAFSAFLVLSCYWQPLFSLFSLFQSATSYWFRYSYICIFGFITVAAHYYEVAGTEIASPEAAPRRGGVRSRYESTVFIAPFLIAAMTLVCLRGSQTPMESLVVTIFFTAVISTLLYLSGTQFHHKKVHRAPTVVINILLLATISVELGYNAYLLAQIYSVNNVETRTQYVSQQELQISSIEKMDTTAYRISQDSNFRIDAGQLTANYNEGLAYGYPSISTYTSDPVNIQRAFFDKLGYRACGDTLYITNDSILAADSLLGVKYLLLEEEIPGLIPLPDLPRANGKSVYLNPYALPLAFISEGQNEDLTAEGSTNPFVYQNALFSSLVGEDVELYKPVAYTESSISKDGRVVTTIQLDSSVFDSPLYGNILLADQWSPSSISIDENELAYSQWLSPSVFHIPEQGSRTLVLDRDELNSVLDIQLYYLDLKLLESAVTAIREKGNTAVTLGNCSAIITISEAAHGDELVTTIPYDSGWSATVNGKQAPIQQVYSCLMSIPLEDGENTIELHYNLKGQSLGIMISGLSLIILLAIATASHLKRAIATHRGLGSGHNNA